MVKGIMKLNQKIIIVLLILILGIGTFLRIYKLASHDLWFDEAISVSYFKNIDIMISDNINAPLYYILLYSWATYFGDSEFSLRLLSVLFGIFSIFMIYRVGKLFFDDKIGIISGFIFAVSPIHIWYAQEVREYAILPFLIMLLVYFFILALKWDKNHYWLGFTLTSIASIYINYISFLIIPAEGLLFLFKKYRKAIKKWLLSCFIISIAFLPYVYIFVKQFLRVKEDFWVIKPTLLSILITFKNFNTGYNSTHFIYSASLFLCLSLFVLGIIYLWKQKEKLLILLSFLFIPIIVLFIISQWMPIYIDRLLIAFSPFYYIVIAYGWKKIRFNILRIAFTIFYLLLVSSSLINYYSDYIMPYNNSSLSINFLHHFGVHPKKPFKSAVEYIKERWNKGDIVAFSDPSAGCSFWYYGDSEGERNGYFFIDSLLLDKFWKRNFNIAALHKYYKKRIIELEKNTDFKKYSFKRIWLISSSWARDGNLDQHSLSVKKWVDSRYIKLESKEFDGIYIGLYKI